MTTFADLDAECAVLGAAILDPMVAAELSSEVPAEAWYRIAHRLIAQAIGRLVERGTPVDLLTLRVELGDELPVVGGVIALSNLSDSVAVTSNWAAYADVVRKWHRVRLLRDAAATVTEVLNSPDALPGMMQGLETVLVNVGECRERAPSHVSAAIRDWLDTLEKPRQFISTGLEAVDELMGGLQPGHLVVVAGRPAMGKTAFVLHLARRACAVGPVAVLSLEMPRGQLVERLICGGAELDAERVRRKVLGPTEERRLMNVAGQLYELPLHLVDDVTALAEVRVMVRRLARAPAGLRVVIIDYLQLLRGEKEQREQEIAEISRALKALALELGICVVACSQLSRTCEQRSDKRPIPSDLRESGQIEQDADSILFLYRPWVYDRLKGPEFELDEELKEKAEIIIGKNRHGSIGTAQVKFIPRKGVWANE